MKIICDLIYFRENGRCLPSWDVSLYWKIEGNVSSISLVIINELILYNWSSTCVSSLCYIIMLFQPLIKCTLAQYVCSENCWALSCSWGQILCMVFCTSSCVCVSCFAFILNSKIVNVILLSWIQDINRRYIFPAFHLYISVHIAFLPEPSYKGPDNVTYFRGNLDVSDSEIFMFVNFRFILLWRKFWEISVDHEFMCF